MAESCPIGKQNQANIGSHNQAINYGNLSPPTLIRKSEGKKGVTGTRRLQLQLSNSICKLVLTGVPIKGDDGQPLMVKLIDRQTGRVVTSGPEASARVEIVGLQADFGVCLGDNWTREEFKSKIVTKEGMKWLLTGNVFLELKEGIGCVGIVRFSHTKKWKMKCAYRLGAIVADDDIGTQIREGFTESFVVKDRRLSLNQKHNPPTLSDKVWRLYGIAKDGPFHQRLSDINIKTVEGFLEKLNTDSQKLRDVFGKGMSAIKWEALIAHARTSKVDKRLPLKSTTNLNKIDFHQLSYLTDFQARVILLISSLSPIKKKCNEKQFCICQKRNELYFMLFNDDLAFFNDSSGPCNNICLPESPIQESFNGGKSLITVEHVSPKPVVSDLYNELFKPNDHHKHEKPLNFSSQMTEPVYWEMLPTIQPWLNPQLFSVDNVPFDSQGLMFESLSNPQKDKNGLLDSFDGGDSRYKQPPTGGGNFTIPNSYELGFISFDNDSTKPAVSLNSMEFPWTSPDLSPNVNELYFPEPAVSSPYLWAIGSSSCTHPM